MANNLYIRRDTDNGVLTNEEDIAYYKSTQEVEIISNYLLGDFNDDGEYIISEDIIDELVQMPKGITNEFSNMIFCVSKVITEYVEVEKFVVKIRYDEDDPSIKIATLEVLEDVKKVEGYIVNSLSTAIAEFVDVASENYKEKMFEAFNIIDKTELSTSQIDKFAHGKVSLRRKFISSIQKICNPQLEEAHKTAYLKKLEILKQSGKVGENTIKLFEDRLKNKPIIATKNNFKALNELLDSVIEVHKEELKSVMPQIRKVGLEFNEKVEQIQKLSFQNLKNMQKTPVAIKAIQSQQDAIFNNKNSKKIILKQIITEEVKETDYSKKITKQNLVKEEFNNQEIVQPKKERVNILRSLFGLGNREKTEKTDVNKNSKEANNADKNKKVVTKEETKNKDEKKTTAETLKSTLASNENSKDNKKIEKNTSELNKKDKISNKEELNTPKDRRNDYVEILDKKSAVDKITDTEKSNEKPNEKLNVKTETLDKETYAEKLSKKETTTSFDYHKEHTDSVKKENVTTDAKNIEKKEIKKPEPVVNETEENKDVELIELGDGFDIANLGINLDGKDGEQIKNYLNHLIEPENEQTELENEESQNKDDSFGIRFDNIDDLYNLMKAESEMKNKGVIEQETQNKTIEKDREL